MNKQIKIMLVEDNPIFRDSIALSMAKESDLQLASQFGTAEQALHSLRDQSIKSIPDLILLDLNLPGMSGIEALPYFNQSIPNTKIIALTQSDRESDILAAIRAGCSGYLLKSATVNVIKDGIRTVIKGGSSLDSKVATLILDTMRKTKKSGTLTDHKLSERETEILNELGNGLLKKEIAEKLSISSHTVSNHIRHIYEKLNVQNAPAAISKAYQTGILPSND